MSDAKKTRVKLEVFEIESLNVDQLDVEELEQRIELSTGVPTEMGWVCDCDGNCTNCQHCATLCTCDGTNTCTTYCGADCASNCAYLCTNDCALDTCLSLTIPV